MKLASRVNYPAEGKYLVAVSGGVDSVALLDLLVQSPSYQHGDYELIVAHFDHGMRTDSGADARLVALYAKEYGLEFEIEQAMLGSDASEAMARQARYDFLFATKSKYQATAILTAHHLDDRIETMLLNQQRGAGWYGLSALKDTANVRRPLLKVWKRELVSYVKSRDIIWHEDATNQVLDTPRNHLRHQLSKYSRPELARLKQQLEDYDLIASHKLAKLLPLLELFVQCDEFSLRLRRTELLLHNAETAQNLIYLALRKYFPHIEVDRKLIFALERFIKTARVGKQFTLNQETLVTADKTDMVILMNPSTR